MKQGRPTKHDRRKIKKILQPYYQKGVSSSAASRETKLNIKTVLRYFSEWDKKILEHDEGDFLKCSKIAKEKAIQSLDDEIISLYMQEKEINSVKNIARQTGNILHFEKLSRLKLKISDQKLKTLSVKTNLINTPTFADMIRLENKDE